MRKNFIVLLSLLSVLFCSCSKTGQDAPAAVNPGDTQVIPNQEGNPEQDRQSEKSPENTTDAYLSITETRWNNGMDSSEGMTILEFAYDIDSGELEEIGGVAYTSQYPLAVYSREDDVIYFSADGETGKNRVQVIIVAVSTTETILRPYIYEKATGEVHKVEVYEDFDIKEQHEEFQGFKLVRYVDKRFCFGCNYDTLVCTGELYISICALPWGQSLKLVDMSENA